MNEIEGVKTVKLYIVLIQEQYWQYITNESYVTMEVILSETQ